MRPLFSLALLASLSIPGASQQNSVKYAVYAPKGNSQVLLDISGRRIPAISVSEVRDIPINVVVVLSPSLYEGPLSATAKNYAESVLGGLPMADMNMAVLVSNDSASVVARAKNLNALIASMDSAQAVQSSSRSNGLYEAISKAATMIAGSSGSRSVIVISESDGNLNKARRLELKRQLAGAHIRVFSILLANDNLGGSKVKGKSGVSLGALCKFSGGRQYETDWQNRRSDPRVLARVSDDLASGSLIEFSLPQDALPPGDYNAHIRAQEGKRTLKSTPFEVLP